MVKASRPAFEGTVANFEFKYDGAIKGFTDINRLILQWKHITNVKV